MTTKRQQPAVEEIHADTVRITATAKCEYADCEKTWNASDLLVASAHHEPGWLLPAGAFLAIVTANDLDSGKELEELATVACADHLAFFVGTNVVELRARFKDSDHTIDVKVVEGMIRNG